MDGTGIRVLVVGAGIAGLAAARTLGGWGAAVEIVERLPAPPRGGGIYLPGNAVRALHALGIGEPVLARAVRIHRQRTSDHRGRLLIDVDVDELWGGVGPCVALPRADLHEVLLAAIGDVRIAWGATPQRITQDDVGVTVQTSGGHTGRYDLVLGADGVRSTVRRVVFGPVGLRGVDQYARRFVVSSPEAAETWSVMLGPRSAFLSIPIGGGQVYCYTDGPLDDQTPPPPTLLSGYAEPVPTLLRAAEAGGAAGAVHAARTEEVVLDSWADRRVLLIGDAAHATSPNMAQGAAMALEDALVLVDCLVTADTISAALPAYEHRRRRRTDWVLTQTRRRDRARRLPPLLRNVVLSRHGERMFRANYLPLRAEP